MSTPHDQAHTGPIKTPQQLLAGVVLGFVLPIFIIIGLAVYVTSAPKSGAGAGNMEMAIAKRIQKVGDVTIAVDEADRPLHSGEEVFKAQCAACHATGAAGAPKYGDAGEWGPRIKTGYDTLLNAALHGMGAMPPQSGGQFNETEIARAVVYMANAGGAQFDEPQAPAAEDGDKAADAK